VIESREDPEEAEEEREMEWTPTWEDPFDELCTAV
jgi:hypothetical protein